MFNKIAILCCKRGYVRRLLVCDKKVLRYALAWKSRWFDHIIKTPAHL